jgi:hypothetical protein
VVSVGIVAFTGSTLADHMSDRRNFADSELHRDVMERWGAPIRQPAPSLREVPTGAVFNSLAPLPLDRQEIALDATMNYRKRGLVYFSGFDFAFRGDYRAINTEKRDIDVVFVFPIDLERNKVLLSDLDFSVNGAASRPSLAGADKLVWTGRLKPGEQVDFHVGFRGRGLDSFKYEIDPATPVRNFHLACHISGGANFDYADGMVAAQEVRTTGTEAWLDWRYTSLESGIPVGVILPSEKSFDRLIATMVGRSWAPFLLLLAAILALAVVEGRALKLYETALIAVGYALFFVLLAYLGAFMGFPEALSLSLAIGCGLLTFYLHALLSSQPWRRLLLLLVATIVVPTMAVILQGYTGLIYTLESTVLVAGLMYLTTRSSFRALLAKPAVLVPPGDLDHA